MILICRTNKKNPSQPCLRAFLDLKWAVSEHLALVIIMSNLACLSSLNLAVLVALDSVLTLGKHNNSNRII